LFPTSTLTKLEDAILFIKIWFVHGSMNLFLITTQQQKETQKYKMNRSTTITTSWILPIVLMVMMIMIQSINSKCAFTTLNDYRNDTMGGNPPQIYNGEGFRLTDDYYAKLMKQCPHILPGTPVCCNNSQVDVLLKNMLRIEITMWHCPACMNNFKRMWCDFTCREDQGEFIDVNELYPAPYNSYIQSVKFNVNGNWSEQLWNSCKDNQLGAGPVKKQFANVKLMLEGLLKADPPKPMVYFNFGEVENMEFGFKTTVAPCEGSCMCEYCEASCSSGKKIVPDFTCRIGTTSCMKFGLILLGICLALLVFALSIVGTQRLLSLWIKRDKQVQVVYHQTTETSSLLVRQ
jgi:hypothetical protein